MIRHSKSVIETSVSQIQSIFSCIDIYDENTSMRTAIDLLSSDSSADLDKLFVCVKYLKKKELETEHLTSCSFVVDHLLAPVHVEVVLFKFDISENIPIWIRRMSLEVQLIVRRHNIRKITSK